MAGNQIQFRADPDTLAWIEGRRERALAAGEKISNVSAQAQAELSLHRALLAEELSRITMPLPWAQAIADVVAGPQFRLGLGYKVGRLYAECVAAFRESRDQARQLGLPEDTSSFGAKHGIDESALLEWLGSLGPAADHALHDAFTRWWAMAGEEADSAEGFAAVGLRVGQG